VWDEMSKEDWIGDVYTETVSVIKYVNQRIWQWEK
jgi:hypothetical protein